MMNKDFSYYLSKFLKEHLVVEINASPKTIKSYKTTFKLLVEYLVNEKDMKLTDITFANVTRDIILDFLKSLEEKGNSIRTRNQRLAAIKSFYNFCALEEIENIENINKVLSIKSKKFLKPLQDYLTEEETKELFDSIDTSTFIGKRNLLILVLLYDTAARANEIINLKLENINLEEKRIILIGKGNKARIVPIMENTKQMLASYMQKTNNLTYLFENKTQKYNERFIRDILLNVNLTKKISPHTIRRSRAPHLLNKGVNMLYIKELLGHESITTTEDYVRGCQANKFDAIKNASHNNINDTLEDWNDNQDLLSLLINL